MIEPSDQYPDAPTVTIGGKKWPIPKLAARQLMSIRRPVIDLNTRLHEVQVAAIKSEADRAAAVSAAIDAANTLFAEMPADDWARLIVDVVYMALTRAHPKLTRDEFLDLEYEDGAMIMAWYVVRDQSGVFYKAKPEDVPQQGEEQGAQSPTSTGSE